VDAVVAGVGIGGTLMGIAGVMFKEAKQVVKVIAVEPEEASIVLTLCPGQSVRRRPASTNQDS